jgi:hypothetical protein
MKKSPWNHSDCSDAELIAHLREIIHEQNSTRFRRWIMSDIRWSDSPCPQIFNRIYHHANVPFGLAEWMDAARAVQILEDFSRG